MDALEATEINSGYRINLKLLQFAFPIPQIATTYV
jgi:hypothetical protein